MARSQCRCVSNPRWHVLSEKPRPSHHQKSMRKHGHECRWLSDLPCNGPGIWCACMGLEDRSLHTSLQEQLQSHRTWSLYMPGPVAGDTLCACLFCSRWQLRMLPGNTVRQNMTRTCCAVRKEFRAFAFCHRQQGNGTFVCSWPLCADTCGM